ncbi:hypothetical protein PF008_g21466 [Phytophthora fragariae]|uniref:Integrase catalytic domain-containing protein n=1 Tax=Phytophthora fragariae TaxID=53985 RepID=A0A6G0QX88_9STRA|nr:hypothetical protein PF008_g21466 [Phytophthora fragariae]
MSTNPPEESERKVFLDRGNMRLLFTKHGKHYRLKTVDEQVEVDAVMMMTVNADANPLMRWHERLGRLNVAAIKHMVETGKVSGMAIPKELFKKKFTCLSCMSAKAKRKSYKQSAAEKRTKVNYERLTSDTCDMGKYLPGLAGLRYFQLIQDEGSRYKWCFPLKKKSGANANTIRLMTELLAQGQRIKTITTDGGGEFMNTELKLFCASRGIRLVPTHPYTPKENALVEKLNGVLVGKMRAAMHAANLPDRLWPEVLPYIVDVDNMSSTRALNGKTPSVKLLGKVPDVKKIRACGSVGFIHVAKQKRKTKLNPRAEPALLLGFGQTSPGYRLLHLRTGKIVETRDVRFREDITVGRSYINSLLMGQQANYKQIPFVPLPVEYVATESVRSSAEQTVGANIPKNADITPASNAGAHEVSSSGSDDSEPEDELPQEAGEEDTGNQSQPQTTGRQQAGAARGGGRRPAPRQTRRQRRAAAATAGQQENGEPLRRSTRATRLNVRLDGYVLALVEEFVGTPASVQEAIRSPKWRAAMMK